MIHYGFHIFFFWDFYNELVPPSLEPEEAIGRPVGKTGLLLCSCCSEIKM